MPFYRVIFRTCDRVPSVHAVPRPFGLDKSTLIRLSFLSLYESIKKFPHKITVVGDALSDETLRFFKRFPVAFDNHPPLGNDASIRETVRIAAEAGDDEWVYFCEDDYLHTPDCFDKVNELIENRDAILATRPSSGFSRFFLRGNLSNRPLTLFLADYPDRYSPTQRKASLIFKAPTCHWRQTTNTTFSFLIHSRWVKKFRKVFIKASLGANDGYLSRRLYSPNFYLDFLMQNRGLCLSPIPGLSTHTHEGTMTPLVDWEALIKNWSNRI